jgi:hypothetical protein
VAGILFVVVVTFTVGIATFGVITGITGAAIPGIEIWGIDWAITRSLTRKTCETITKTVSADSLELSLLRVFILLASFLIVDKGITLSLVWIVNSN